ncbi:uncharacterized protein CC84DRAFT_1158411 [Paraphaeosphaeria sporulosa]|uniref:Glycoside hydrolase n=1 Tax=Paraphaeosphaeria sporulosa TaxID=1460663 RepID=A0A177BVV7_9PLEO|nr:uncharacterized protein CC84DRAFT_1158411 [Paraphaeosphaeria sporulosa]OAF98798.1 hypothetical protein CC84DRAFT_1158411 [Paraphaeosphaeria sporulosa]
MRIKHTFFSFALLKLSSLVRCEPPFNNPPGVDVWCGKAYRETNSSFDPGGWLEPPARNNGSRPLQLRLNVYPRYNFYVEGEKQGSFIVDTRVSDQEQYGGSYMNETHGDGNGTAAFTKLVLNISIGDTVVVDNLQIPVNTTGIEIPFDLDLAKLTDADGTGVFLARGSSPDGKQLYEDLAHVVLFPERSDGGSMARLDRLNGGIHVSSSLTNGAWKSVLPMGFYTRWDWISNETKSLQQYKDRGYNLIHPVPPGGWASFDTGTFEKFLTICDELELYVMYDMRHTYLNLSSISYQLPRLQSHPSLLLYYTGDEPDGWTDPLNGTLLAYKHIKSIDPYHPTSLVLNCYNFYFEDYTSGADIILEDTYNLIKSSTFSPVYNTVCNRTYGDCGCDFCHANDTAYPMFVERPFEDIVERTRKMYQYQRWLGQKETKPVWGVPQWFYDADSFWSRWATREEAVVLALLRINHGAMGIVGWLFPTSPEVESATTDLAKVLARDDVTRLLVDCTGQRVMPEPPLEDSNLDVAAWVGGDEILVVIVWPQYEPGDGAILKLPTGGKRVTDWEVLYGAKWMANGRTISKEGTASLEVSILKGRIRGY